MTSPPTDTLDAAVAPLSRRHRLGVGERRPDAWSPRAPARREPDSTGPAPPPARSLIGVLLVDEHPAVRAVMRELIDAQPGMRVVGEATNARAALDLADRLQADVAVVDLAMPGPGGDALIRQLRRLHPAPRVVATSMHDGRHFAHAAVRAGASGFLLKDCAGSGLVGAISAAAGGQPLHRPWPG